MVTWGNFKNMLTKVNVDSFVYGSYVFDLNVFFKEAKEIFKNGVLDKWGKSCYVLLWWKWSQIKVVFDVILVLSDYLRKVIWDTNLKTFRKCQFSLLAYPNPNYTTSLCSIFQH